MQTVNDRFRIYDALINEVDGHQLTVFTWGLICSPHKVKIAQKLYNI